MVAHQYSGLVYFLLLSILLLIGGIREGARNVPVPLAIYLIGAVTLANLVEALVRVPGEYIFTPGNIVVLLLMSSVQVFLITSLVNISQFQKTLVLDEQQRVSYEKMLIVASDLYDELFYMQKSMENIENIMAKSYNLHKQLKELQPADRTLVRSALEIAEEVHEVKKDTVRILAGLGEVLKMKNEKPVMNLSEILDLVIKTNRSYSQSLDKKIQYNLRIEEDLEVEQIYPLLAILNNLVSNAVEAITGEGLIRLRVRCRSNVVRITVCDNGEPIKERDRALIFEPGFTTKFSEEGTPSTGIGLAYVKGLVENFRGRVMLREENGDKCFVIIIPVDSIAGQQR